MGQHWAARSQVQALSHKQADHNARLPGVRLPRSVLEDRAELKFSIFLSFVWLKHQVAVHDDPDWETCSDGECRLDVEIAPNQLLTGLIK